jgi:hypothetical protein
MWSRQGDLYAEVQSWKSKLGDIPPETCPLIDEVIKVLDTPDATPEMLKAIETMEKIREHNGNLRNFGKEWYENCELLCAKSDDIIEDIEKECKEFENEVQDLKNEKDWFEEKLKLLQ